MLSAFRGPAFNAQALSAATSPALNTAVPPPARATSVGANPLNAPQGGGGGGPLAAPPTAPPGAPGDPTAFEQQFRRVNADPTMLGNATFNQSPATAPQLGGIGDTMAPAWQASAQNADPFAAFNPAAPVDPNAPGDPNAPPGTPRAPGLGGPGARSPALASY